MPGRFLVRRSEAARAQAQCAVQISTQSITTLVALVTTLADRMDALPSSGLERDRERRARVQVLRRTAEAGVRTLAAAADRQRDPRVEADRRA